jgi:hypothetical protein
MSGTWYYVEVEDSTISEVLGADVRRHFLISVRGELFEENRTLDEVTASAVAKGSDYRFVSRLTVAPWHLDLIDRLILARLRNNISRNVRRQDVSVEPLAMITGVR